MNWLWERRQQFFFTLLLVLTALASAWGYQRFRGEYILYHKAENLFINQDYRGAIEVFQQAFALGLDLPQARRRLADSYLATRNFSPAFELYKKIARDYPGDAEVAAKLAQLHSQFGQPRQALVIWARLAQENPGQARYLFEAGKAHQDLSQYPEAERLFNEVLQMDPNSAAAKRGLADIYSWTGRYDQAVDLLRDILTQSPRDRSARIKLGRVLSWRGDLGAAIMEYQKALEDAP
ncbi:MAG: tetratricopeptide repeat protein [Pseudomonadota bacterium]